MSWIFDVIVLLIIVLFVILDFKRGFVMVLFSTLSIFVAMAIACIISVPASEAVYDNFVKEGVQKQVSLVVEMYGSQTDQAIDTLLGDGNNSLGAIVKICGLDAEQAKMALGSEQITDEVTAVLCEKVIRQPMLEFLKVLCTIVAFLALRLVFRLLGKPIGRLFQKMSIIGGINRLLGGVLGIVHGIIIALLVLGILYLILSFSGGIAGLTSDMIQNSTTVSVISGIIPI